MSKQKKLTKVVATVRQERKAEDLVDGEGWISDESSFYGTRSLVSQPTILDPNALTKHLPYNQVTKMEVPNGKLLLLLIPHYRTGKRTTHGISLRSPSKPLCYHPNLPRRRRIIPSQIRSQVANSLNQSPTS